MSAWQRSQEMSQLRNERPALRWLGFALVLAAVFGAWEILFADFMADDLLQIGILEGVSPAAAWTGALDLYTISDGNPTHVRAMKDAGIFPWFVDPTFEMRFLRPLSSALLVVDHALFGLRPAGYRLHGVLWSLVLVTAVGLMLRRALSGRVGTIALFVFVLSGIHATFCWTAARHIVIAAALGFAGLAAHLRWREDGWFPGAVLSVVALVLSLAASEVGVAVAIYLLAYEGVGSLGAPASRLRAAVPALAALGAYVFTWQLLGHGVSANSGYLDPVRDTAGFLRELPGRLAVLTGGVVMDGGADLWVLRPGLRPALVAAGAVATLGFAGLLCAAWGEATAGERRALRWLGVAAVVSAVPFTGTPIGSRCLLVPFVGGAALVGVVVNCWWTTWRHRCGLRYRALGAASVALAILHLGLGPIARLTIPVLLKRTLAERVAAVVRDTEVDPATLPTQTAVVLVAPDFVVGLHSTPYRLLHRLPIPAAWRVLSWAPGTHRFVRAGADTLEMQVEGGEIASATLVPDTVITLRGMEVTVLAADERGSSRVRIQFDRSLDEPSLVLLAWSNGRLRRIAPPPLGETIVVSSDN